MKPNQNGHYQYDNQYDASRGYTQALYQTPQDRPLYPGLGSTPYGGGQTQIIPSTAVGAAADAGASSGSGFSITQIKGFIDRMGGVEGIMSTMNKVQSFVKNMQQMAPMLKLLMGSFGGKATTARKRNQDAGDGLPIVRRKRRHRSAAVARPRSRKPSQQRRRKHR